MIYHCSSVVLHSKKIIEVFISWMPPPFVLLTVTSISLFWDPWYWNCHNIAKSIFTKKNTNKKLTKTSDESSFVFRIYPKLCLCHWRTLYNIALYGSEGCMLRSKTRFEICGRGLIIPHRLTIMIWLHIIAKYKRGQMITRQIYSVRLLSILIKQLLLPSGRICCDGIVQLTFARHNPRYFSYTPVSTSQ